MDEKHALKALKQRDETALAWFIERYSPYVNTIIYQILARAMSFRDVEEVSSDVFLVLWRNAEKIQEGKVKAYLSRTELHMTKALSAPIPYVERAILSGAHPTDGDVFIKIWYAVYGRGLDAETLLETIAP